MKSQDYLCFLRLSLFFNWEMFGTVDRNLYKYREEYYLKFRKEMHIEMMK